MFLSVHSYIHVPLSLVLVIFLTIKVHGVDAAPSSVFFANTTSATKTVSSAAAKRKSRDGLYLYILQTFRYAWVLVKPRSFVAADM